MASLINCQRTNKWLMRESEVSSLVDFTVLFNKV